MVLEDPSPEKSFARPCPPCVGSPDGAGVGVGAELVVKISFPQECSDMEILKPSSDCVEFHRVLPQVHELPTVPMISSAPKTREA